jgi:hypothetical protein
MISNDRLMRTLLMILKVVMVTRKTYVHRLETTKTVDDAINDIKEKRTLTCHYVYIYAYIDDDYARCFLSLLVYEKRNENMVKKRPCSSFFVVHILIDHPDH